jgi:hypothetical protein
VHPHDSTEGAGACPRCGGRMGERPGATSRADDETEICERCGVEEALRDARGLPRIPLAAWPVARHSAGSKSQFEHNREEVLALVERVGRTLGPGDDWAPVLMIDRGEARTVVGLGDLFTAEESKTLAAETPVSALFWAAFRANARPVATPRLMRPRHAAPYRLGPGWRASSDTRAHAGRLFELDWVYNH